MNNGIIPFLLEHAFTVYLFLQVFVQVLILLYLLDGPEPTTKKRTDKPSVSIIVPAYNEESTVQKTIDSLLQLKYPKQKLHIFVVDDGSTDGTWDVLQQYADHPQIVLMQKENGGSKYHALNFALKHIKSEIFGCLDADSSVDPYALSFAVREFTSNDIAAVVPSMLIDEPKGFFRQLQRIEYEIGSAIRKAFAGMDALYVTPGPFSLFRTDLVKKLGGYSFAHHTEDLELALKIHKLKQKIVYAERALVYTVGPDNYKALLKQRIRWLSGFLKNMLDYKEFFFRPQFGNLGLIILPYSLFSILITLYLAPNAILNAFNLDPSSTFQIFQMQSNALPAYYISIPNQFIITGMLIVILLLVMLIGKRISGRKVYWSDIPLLLIYPIFAMIWSLRAIFETLTNKNITWR